MHLIQQILFIICAAAAIYFFTRKVRQIRRNINLGRDEDISDDKPQRWKNMFLLALGQKKMFKKPIPALLHLAVYAGFIIINIEIFEIFLDGISGNHRLFAPMLGGLYAVLIGCFEILAILVLVGCAIFLIRRNILRVRRLNMKELNGWPREDANVILITEIILMGLFLTMNTTDLILQSRHIEHYTTTAPFWISNHFTFMYAGLSDGSLIGLERTCWWLHILGVFLFLNYLPYSKHFHIILAFPNAYYGPLLPPSEMKNMPEIQNEVLYMMEPDKAPAAGGEQTHQRFGAKDVPDLSWKNLMDAYSCTECGRCTAVCPANLTGKKLSPRKIMMDTRDRMEEIGRNIDANKTFQDDGKTLVNDYITVEELRACTTCQACVEACPVSINPLSIILQLRRSLVMEESNAPQEWNLMFGNIENNMAPWKFSPDERDKWAEELNS
ncbi:MAG TPA: (Fe-S)-binding protein [Flavipsychrobacter sp.]|nr:(Fe-S)-binding protein [Flavipsychrobacter sp.]